MFKIKSFYPLFILAGLAVFSCKKYQDGPYLSFQSKEKRIIGDWYIDQAILVQQIDTAEIYEGYVFHFGADSTTLIDYPNLGNPDTVSGRWFLADNKETFRWLLNREPDNCLFDSMEIFDIFRLTSKDFQVYDKENTLIKFGPN
ncbi:MAG: hypothetical protein KDC34_13990 [Saprospiraceae bacterium]|nr:hypothetical protein [Saprospiraceae bacterium]